MRFLNKATVMCLTLVLICLNSSASAQRRKTDVVPHDTCGSGSAKLSAAYWTFQKTGRSDSILIILATPAKGESRRVSRKRVTDALHYLSREDGVEKSRLIGAVLTAGEEYRTGYLTLLVNGEPINKVIIPRNKFLCSELQ